MADGILSNTKISMYDDKVRLWGLGSSFDTQSLVDMELELLKLEDAPYENQIKYAQEEITVWQSLQSVLQEFVDASKAVKDLNVSNRKISMSQSGYVNVTAKGEAIDANYSISVQNVATRHKLLGSDMGSSTTALGMNGTVELNGKELTITSDMNLNQIANAINIGSYNMSAVILNNNIILTSKSTGVAGEMQFTDSGASQSHATSYNSSIANVTLTGTPTVGVKNYGINITQLAEKQRVESSVIADKDAALNASGTFILNGESFEVLDTDSAQDLVDKINSSSSVGVAASLNENNELVIESKEVGASGTFTLVDNTTQDGNKLFEALGLLTSDGSFVNQTATAQDAAYTVDGGEVLTSTTNTIQLATGVQVKMNAVGVTTLAVNGSSDGILKSLGILASDGSIQNELELAKDAKFTVDGIEMTSSRNTITNMVEGVSIELLQPTTSNVSVNVEHDNSLIKEKVDYFVKVYNNTMKGINTLTSEGGVLQGETIVNRSKNGMNKELMFQNGAEVMLYELGISIDGTLKNGMITYDSSKLDSMLESNYDEVMEFLAGEGGFADNMYDMMKEIAGDAGSIFNKIQGLKKVIDQNQKTLDKRAEQYEIKQQTILQKYAYFEVMMSQLNSQMDYMTAQMESLNGSKN